MDTVLDAIVTGVVVSFVVWALFVEPSRIFNKYALGTVMVLWTLLVPIFLIAHPRFETIWVDDPIFSRIELVLVASGVLLTHSMLLITALRWKTLTFLNNRILFTYAIYLSFALGILQAVFWQITKTESDSLNLKVVDTLNAVLGTYLIIELIRYIIRDRRFIRVKVETGGKQFPTTSKTKTVQIETDFSLKFIMLYSMWYTIFALRAIPDLRSIVVVIASLMLPLFLWTMGHDWLQTRPICSLGTIIVVTWLQLQK